MFSSGRISPFDRTFDRNAEIWVARAIKATISDSVGISKFNLGLGGLSFGWFEPSENSLRSDHARLLWRIIRNDARRQRLESTLSEDYYGSYLLKHGVIVTRSCHVAPTVSY